MPTLAKDKRAHYDYKILEEFEAGLELLGHEVKSVKNSHLSLEGSFISIKNGQAWLKNLHISPYSKAGRQLQGYNPVRDRRLLLKRKEILYLSSKTDNKGLTIIPISVYTTRRLIKVKIALAKGKKQFDKRQDIKKRDIKRTIAKKIKNPLQIIYLHGDVLYLMSNEIIYSKLSWRSH